MEAMVPKEFREKSALPVPRESKDKWERQEFPEKKESKEKLVSPVLLERLALLGRLDHKEKLVLRVLKEPKEKRAL